MLIFISFAACQITHSHSAVRDVYYDDEKRRHGSCVIFDVRSQPQLKCHGNTHRRIIYYYCEAAVVGFFSVAFHVSSTRNEIV